MSERPPFRERYRRAFNRRGSDWWSIVFGYPLARLLAALLEPVRAITPNRVSLAGFVCKLGAAGLLLCQSFSAAVAAAVLLQVSQVLDSLDGTLARLRGQQSALGAFLDRALDAAALVLLFAVVGARAFQETGDPWLLLLACGGGGACMVIHYLYWVARALGDDLGGPPIVEAAPAPSARNIVREWLRGWLRMPLVQEADLFFWIALFALLGAWRVLCVFLAFTQLVKLFIAVIYYGVRFARRAG